MIPLMNIQRQNISIHKELQEKFREILKRSNFINGSELEQFEKSWAEYNKSNYAIGINSGTSALYLCLKYFDIKEGDEVIVPTLTFIATAQAVEMCGATPVFVDIDPDTYLMDINKIKITKKTKAIIPVHLYGLMVDVPSLKEKFPNIVIIEDACQAHGAMYKWCPPGMYSDAACYSFFPSKNLSGVGDSGAITTNNKQLAEYVRKARDHGRTDKYIHTQFGFNFRMSEIIAGILNVKLKYFDQWQKDRMFVVEQYNRYITFKRQKIPLNNISSYHLYVIQIEHRDKLQQYLNEHQISTGIQYPIPLHLQPAYGYLKYKKGDFPIAEKVCNEILSLPSCPFLKYEEQNNIIRRIRYFIEYELNKEG